MLNMHRFLSNGLSKTYKQKRSYGLKKFLHLNYYLILKILFIIQLKVIKSIIKEDFKIQIDTTK